MQIALKRTTGSNVFVTVVIMETARYGYFFNFSKKLASDSYEIFIDSFSGIA